MFVPLGDAAGKLMTGLGIAPIFVAWARYGVGVILVVPLIQPAKLAGLLRNWRVWLRGLCQSATIVTILTALSTEPIANVFGAFFLGPMISYVLSIWLLKEQGHTLRILLLALGLVGVMMVVRPGFGMTPGLGWAVISGVFYGLFLTASRWVAPLGAPRQQLAAQLIVGSVILAPFGLAAIPPMNATLLGLLMWSAAASMFGNLALVWAYSRAGASVLAPFVYVQLIGAVLYGVVLFGAWPDWISAVGLIVIFVSGFGTLWLRPSPATRPLEP